MDGVSQQKGVMKKRICLINTLWGSKKAISFAPSLGLGYIAAVLEWEGFQVKIIDRIALYFCGKNIDLEGVDKATIKEILNFRPQYIGITATTIQCFDMFHIIPKIRETHGLVDCIIIAGGFHPSIEPELTLKMCPEIDIVCRGEGELKLLDIVSEKKLEDIPGITFKQNGKFYSTPEVEAIKDIDEVPWPARHLIDMRFYLNPKRNIVSGLPLKTATQLTSRGCPYNCKFCASKHIQKRVRLHSWEYVLKEYEFLCEEYRPELITFMDDMFLASKDRVKKICWYMIEKKMDRRVKWSCSVRTDVVDEEILRLMKRAGCVYVIYGLESGSQKMLDYMNKQTTVEQNINAVHAANRAGILINSAFIVNLPGETEQDFQATLKFIKNNKIYMPNLNNLMVLPGSKYYDEIFRDKIFNPTKLLELWQNIAKLPESIDDIRKLPIYSSIPREKFLQLWENGWEIVSYKANINYALVNWYRTPLESLKRLLAAVLPPILGGKKTKIWQFIKKMYFEIEKICALQK